MCPLRSRGYSFLLLLQVLLTVSWIFLQFGAVSKHLLTSVGSAEMFTTRIQALLKLASSLLMYGARIMQLLSRQ